MSKKLLAILFCLMLVAPSAYARDFTYGDTGTLGNDEIIIDSDGDIIPVDDSVRTLGETGSEFANIITDAVTIGGVSKTSNGGAVAFTVEDFVLNDGSGINLLTTTSTPGMELDNKAVSVVWADGETTPVSVTFKVPTDYISGAGFRAMVDESGSTTACQVDFNVYVNDDATPWATSATNQTPVALTGVAGSPETVTLSTIATDFNSLAAGDYVTVSVWRDDTATGTNDLELYYLEFYYNE